MRERKFPNLRLLDMSSKGYYFGAYDTTKKDAKKGYDLFISKVEGERDWCECMGVIHGYICYHIKDAKKIFTPRTKNL